MIFSIAVPARSASATTSARPATSTRSSPTTASRWTTIRVVSAAISTFRRAACNTSPGEKTRRLSTASSPTTISDEVANASGGTGQVTLDLEDGQFQIRIDNNTFDTPANAPWFIRSDSTQSRGGPDGRTTPTFKVRSARPIRPRQGGGCDLGGGNLCVGQNPANEGYCGPGLRSLIQVQNGGDIDLTLDQEDFAQHDGYFDPGNTTEAHVVNVGGGGTLCVALSDNTSPDGYGLREEAGTLEFYQGTSATTGNCTNGAPGNWHHRGRRQRQYGRRGQSRDPRRPTSTSSSARSVSRPRLVTSRPAESFETSADPRNRKQPQGERQYVGAFSSRSPHRRLQFRPPRLGFLPTGRFCRSIRTNRFIRSSVPRMAVTAEPRSPCRICAAVPPMHVGSSNGTFHTQGQKSGEETHTLSAAEMPQHAHAVHAVSDSANAGNPTGNFYAKGSASVGPTYATTGVNASLNSATPRQRRRRAGA